MGQQLASRLPLETQVSVNTQLTCCGTAAQHLLMQLPLPLPQALGPACVDPCLADWRLPMHLARPLLVAGLLLTASSPLLASPTDDGSPASIGTRGHLHDAALGEPAPEHDDCDSKFIA